MYQSVGLFVWYAARHVRARLKQPAVRTISCCFMQSLLEIKEDANLYISIALLHAIISYASITSQLVNVLYDIAVERTSSSDMFYLLLKTL